MSKRTGGAVQSLLTAHAAGLTDRELLGRYVAGDQAAFAALVRRHGGMVLGVCRRVLPTVQDSEDACQATFLVLAGRAATGRWQASVANWLYTTARRIAAQATRASRRRAAREVRPARPSPSVLDEMTARELLVAVDEELDRLPPIYREALVLCHLEGLARDEAAVNLGVPLATVKMRLERGRKRLADALTRRGIVLGATLLAVAATSPAGASPPALMTAVLAAVNGSPSATAAALAQGATMNGVFTRAKMLAVAVAGLAVLGFGAAAMPTPADPPKQENVDKPKAEAKPDAKPDEAKPRTVTGTVVGPDGRPVAGAGINTMKPGKALSDKPAVHELAKSAADGTFTVTLDPPPPGQPDFRFLVATKAGCGPDWLKAGEVNDSPVSLKLAADDVPVKGRVTDLEGKPVPRATVRIKTLAAGDLGKVWEMWPRGPYYALRAAKNQLWMPTLAGFPESVTADAEGKFEINGVGRGRLLTLIVEGPGIETAACRVVTDPKFDPKKVEQPNEKTMLGGGFQPGPPLYGPTFTHAGKPSQPVTGTVTDAKSGKPIAGVQVSGHDDGPHWWENHASTRSGADGKFVLTGIAKTDRVRLSVFAGDKSPYFLFETTIGGKPGLTEITAELKLTRGVLVKGRVIEKGGGKPVAGAGVRYSALADNKHFAELMKGKRGEHGMAWNTDADGRFQFVALPGSGIVTAQGETRADKIFVPYTQVRVAKADLPRADLRYADGMGETFSAAEGHMIQLLSQSGYAIIDPKPADDTVEVTITFDRGQTATGKVVDADGKPATGVTAYQLTACYSYPEKIKDGTFTAVALEADHPRTLLFVDEAKKLAGSVELKGGEKDVTVKLEAWGTISGRVLDADGKPLAGAKVTAYVKNSTRYAAFMAVVQQRTAATDADGKFTLDVPAGGVDYLLGFSRKNQYLDVGAGRDPKGHTVKPGATTDVGDVKVKGE